MSHAAEFIGAEKKKYYLTGGFIDGYYAPNISATGLKAASLDDIVVVFKQGKLLGGAGQVGGGPMAEVNSNSLRYLTEEDLRAIAVYLKSVQSQTPTSAFSGPLTAQTGRKVYQKYYATCHANGAAGAPKLGDMGEWNKRLRDGVEPVYQRAIQGYNSMPAKGKCDTCSNAEIEAVVKYLVEHGKEEGDYSLW